MSTRAKQLLAVGGGVLVLAVGAFFLLGGGTEDIPLVNRIIRARTCPLTGAEPPSEKVLDRPAVAVKVENNPDAYPLAGLERAEIVYEELVEGGITRFMAIYHCVDANKAGPIRSSRLIDPAIMTPITRLLAAAGGNAPTRKALDKADIVLIDEPAAGSAMWRVSRPGVASEHTLYGNSAKLRKVGTRKFDDPPEVSYEFGDLDGKAKKASTVTINFSPAVTVTYKWSNGKWVRSDNGAPLVMESGKRIAVDNVLIEEHDMRYSKTVVDVAGNPYVEFTDATGSGRAVLFRDGRVVHGTWKRKSVKAPTEFLTKTGDEMVLRRGTTWIALVPSNKGEVKGSLSYE